MSSGGPGGKSRRHVDCHGSTELFLRLFSPSPLVGKWYQALTHFSNEKGLKWSGGLVLQLDCVGSCSGSLSACHEEILSLPFGLQSVRN